MKILVITREFFPYGGGGLAYHVDYLYSEIADLGHEVTILAGRTGETRSTESRSKADDVDIKWVEYASLSAYHLQFPLSLYHTLEDIDVKEYDVAMAHTEIPYEIGIPTISKFHDAKHEERKHYRQTMGSLMKILDSVIDPTRRWASQRAIDSSDHIVFNSKLNRKTWSREYDLDTPSSVVYNGVDSTVFYPRSNSQEDQEDFVLFVGNVPRKGINEIRSFAQECPYKIRIAGQTDENEANIKSLGFLSQEELAEQYSSAVATIHPARFEAFGNVVLESLACGTPVVVSEQCGASEIIDQSCGVVTANLRAGVETVGDMNARSCVQKASEYSWRKVARRTIEIAEGVV